MNLKKSNTYIQNSNADKVGNIKNSCERNIITPKLKKFIEFK